MSGNLVSLEFDRDAITDIRHMVAKYASDTGLSGDALDDFVLAAHEAVTNAVKYGGAPRGIALWHEERAICCEITDRGPGIPQEILRVDRPLTRSPVGGRGLWLMRRLVRTMIQTGPRGTTVRLSMFAPS